ncbi:NAD(P)-dependent oxidoreductase [Lachnospiraceae bacterium 48-42]|jgi:Nucleoside-diphosphate-sugar epimerases
MGRAVITGATGAIGRALVSEALKYHEEVLVIVRRNSQRAEGLKQMKRCRVLEADLFEYPHIPELMEMQGLEGSGYDIFFHLAWMAPFGADRNNLDLQLANVQAALDAVRLAHKMGCRTFVGTGSQAEYGQPEGALSPDTPAYPETGYGISKLCAGQMTRLLCEQMEMRHIWTRILSVYGPYDRKETLISTAVINMLENKDTIFTPCNQIWDYLYSEDAARAIYMAGEKGKNGAVYMIGSGETRKLSEYIEVIAELTGYTKKIGFGRRAYNDKQVMYLKADISGLKRDTGFVPAVSFEEGIERLIEFYRRQLI